jgi:vacuolar iron transporter family protein
LRWLASRTAATTWPASVWLGRRAAIYQRRGLDEELARTVAGKLMAVDPLAARVRDELGLSEELMARPVQAAAVSATSFAVGAVLPLLAIVLAPAPVRILAVAGAALVVLGVLGGVGRRLGGASPWQRAGRVLGGGGLAMASTAVIGRLVGAVGL